MPRPSWRFYRKLIAPTTHGGYKRAKLRGIAVQKDETPIRKSVGVPLGEHSGFESPPNFPNLHRTSLAGSFELGEAHTGIGWPLEDTIGYVADIVKAMEGCVTELFRYDCGDSAHFKSVAEVRDLWRRKDSRKNKGPLQKSGPLTVFAKLLDFH